MSSHQARKRFGQNFLQDQSVIQSIVSAIDPQQGDSVVEIGPGLCALTDPLMSRLKKMSVIEIDRDLIQRLETRYPDGALTISPSDVLTVDFNQFTTEPRSLRIVGNLPYNISSPLLFHLIDYLPIVKDQHFMLQKEVVDRMVAKPSTEFYGRLSVMLQLYYRMYSLFDVSPDAFNPPPKVTSSIVRMIPLKEDRVKPQNERIFARIVKESFAQRRKMIRKSLATYQIDWETVRVSETARPEQLSVMDFIQIADYVYTHL